MIGYLMRSSAETGRGYLDVRPVVVGQVRKSLKRKLWLLLISMKLGKAAGPCSLNRQICSRLLARMERGG